MSGLSLPLCKLQKELKKLKSDKAFTRVINDKQIANLSPQEFESLKNHTHEDKELQIKFDFGRVMLAKVKELTGELNKLTISK